MPEHYPKNTIEATGWCNKCNALTQHRVDGGRRGPCLTCMAKREKQNEIERIKNGVADEAEREKEQQNPKLF
jgi:ribosomal protein L44E